MRFPYMLSTALVIVAVSNAYPQESRGERGAVQRWPSQGQPRGEQGPPPSAGPRAAVPRQPSQESRGARPGAQASRPDARSQERPGAQAFRPSVPRTEAVPRESPSGQNPTFGAAPVPGATGDARRRFGPVRGSNADDQVFAQRRAEPRTGSRPRGDNPQTGVAVPRGSRPPVTRGDRNGYGYVRPRNNYYYNYPYYSYPRRYYPYGYGGFGLGFFYYDPYLWHGNSWGYYGAAGYPYLGYGYGYDLGKLRLQVRPRDAEVYIDGYYAGVVDDFDGRLQGLALETGGYSVEIRMPGFEPLTFDIRITPGRTTTFRGDLRQLP